MDGTAYALCAMSNMRALFVCVWVVKKITHFCKDRDILLNWNVALFYVSFEKDTTRGTIARIYSIRLTIYTQRD